MPFAAGDDGLRVVGVAHQRQRAVEAGVAVGLAGQAFEQQGVVAGVGLGLAGEARRQHAGGAAEDVDAQPGVVGEGRQAGGAGGVAGLGDGVLDEAGVGLFGFAHVEGRLGQHLDAQRGEQRGEFLEFAGVAAGEHEFVHGGAPMGVRRGRGPVFVRRRGG